mmetsp:Transcript_24993/g.61567  ORF Transcript_24993/g.61567 Transcript_24993/m.61567 type:complete len:236 (-) Transcript_24993:396-1103(-)
MGHVDMCPHVLVAAAAGGFLGRRTWVGRLWRLCFLFWFLALVGLLPSTLLDALDSFLVVGGGNRLSSLGGGGGSSSRRSSIGLFVVVGTTRRLRQYRSGIIVIIRLHGGIRRRSIVTFTTAAGSFINLVLAFLPGWYKGSPLAAQSRLLSLGLSAKMLEYHGIRWCIRIHFALKGFSSCTFLAALLFLVPVPLLLFLLVGFGSGWFVQWQDAGGMRSRRCAVGSRSLERIFFFFF